jgi:hypothetical protein
MADEPIRIGRTTQAEETEAIKQFTRSVRPSPAARFATAVVGSALVVLALVTILGAAALVLDFVVDRL